MLSINELFDRSGVAHLGAVAWGSGIPLDSAGVYVVATTPDPDAALGLGNAPLELSAIDTLLRVRPEATVDGNSADQGSLADRLAQMWVPGHPIVYIGLAGTSVRRRVNQYYDTAIGARAPHAGGWPVKMLRSSGLWVHFGSCADPDLTERTMVQAFIDSVPVEARAGLIDPALPLPFANLTVPRGARKRHGLAGVKAAANDSRAAGSSRLSKMTSRLIPARQPNEAPRTEEPRIEASQPESAVAGATRRTQNVTANDLSSGTLRVPRVSKDVFPSTDGTVHVQIGDRWHEVLWRTGVSKTGERSGLIRLGSATLREHFSVGGPLRITVVPGGYRID